MTRNRAIPLLSQHEKDYVRDLLVHEDEAILAFNKPSGLPSQVRGNRARNLDHLLWTFAKSNGKRPRLVHRLDVGTSGIILAGRTQPDAASLSQSLEHRKARKVYWAIIAGDLPKKSSDAFDDRIARIDEAGRSRMVAGCPDGKRALTRWTIPSRFGDVALIELRPETGRMHQLRVHLAHHGCPILGDTLYNGGPASRLCLHAASIELTHPRDDARIVLKAPLPEVFCDIAGHNGLDCSVFEPPGSG
ncbi:MAG: RluA family pseudouridine synthase [Pseudomonadota bacterium]